MALAPLRAAPDPVVGYVRDDRCLLDLRTVDPDDDLRLRDTVLTVLAALR